MRKLTKEEFIEKAINVHGYLFGYELVNYIDAKTKVEIICKKHGVFLQTPSNHLHGQGCRKCAIEIKANNSRSTTEEFIEKAINVYGYLFGYELVNYIDAKTKVEIICKEHGVFLQTPRKYLFGHGCPTCGIERRSNTRRSTPEEFIEKAINVHGYLFGYELVNYIDAKTKVEIICKEHGIFLQTPSDHLCGRGCRKCNESKGEKSITNILIKKNIKFISQKKFQDCRNKFPLPFDFYLPEHDICIEYQGEQHYEYVNFSGKLTEEQLEENLKHRQEKDQIKRDYCKSNNITLLEIPYWDFSNIEESINNCINKELI